MSSLLTNRLFGTVASPWRAKGSPETRWRLEYPNEAVAEKPQQLLSIPRVEGLHPWLRCVGELFDHLSLPAEDRPEQSRAPGLGVLNETPLFLRAGLCVCLKGTPHPPPKKKRKKKEIKQTKTGWCLLKPIPKRAPSRKDRPKWNGISWFSLGFPSSKCTKEV